MIVLLPPSEGKAPGGSRGTSWSPAGGTFGRSLGDQRREVADALVRNRGGSPALLGVKGDVLARAQEANRTLLGSPTLPAWQRYTGVVWDHLDLGSMSAAARMAAVKSILVPSGLMGLVRADDPVPDYKLKMGASLAPIGRLSIWWRQTLTEELARVSSTTEVIDLLPQEHRGAFVWDSITNVVRVDLVARKGGAVGGHNAKAAKGLLARHLLTTRSGTLARRVAAFRHSDYSARITS